MEDKKNPVSRFLDQLRVNAPLHLSVATERFVISRHKIATKEKGVKK
jgi:hypothetical protein